LLVYWEPQVVEVHDVLVRNDVTLAPLTTLRLGGPASRFVELLTEGDVVDAARDSDSRGEPLFVMGAGSNVVVGDGGFPGLVARIAIRGIDVSREGGRVVLDVAAGEEWDPLVARTVDEQWGGLECMSGIPGLVGATPVQNVGAYGQEVRETIDSVRAYDRHTRGFVDMAAHECGFAYRSSVFKGNPRWIVTKVRLSLAPRQDVVVRYAELARTLQVAEGAKQESRLVRETVLALRRAKGMVLDERDPESVSAGSFFVNPIVDGSRLAEIAVRAGDVPPHFSAGDGLHKVAAAWLVERAGFTKGWGRGRVGISRKHALALVNRGGARTSELVALAREIRDGVLARFGVMLHPEPVFVGCSWEESGL
jgi:UDP-N-acetylmuramate dehydrogenase